MHGFLGPNGSGKTTTIRMLLGLARPDEVEITVLGEAAARDLPAVLGRVGAVVEHPRFSPDLSGRTNLQLLATAAGLAKSRVDSALDGSASPSRAAAVTAATRSGMKQRLGVAAALLGEPELLLLDEPANGLDPAGMRDIRDLVRRLGESGATVLLSSHILAEVQQVCESVSIIGDGRLLASGAVEDLLGERTARTRVGVSDPDRATRVLTEAGYGVAREQATLLVDGHEHPEALTRLLAEHDLYVSELSAARPDLEEFFLRLTGHRPTDSPVEDGEES